MRDRIASIIGAKPGSVVRPIEQATFGGGNGGIGYGVYEVTSVGPDGKTYRQYHLVHHVDHFGWQNESVVDLGTTSVVDWLVEALQRSRAAVQGGESDWSRDFWGPAQVKVVAGQPVPEIPRSVQTESSGEDLTKRVLARHAASRCSSEK